MKGIDLSSFKNLAAAYDAIEPGKSRSDTAKATRDLKKLGY